MRSHFEIVTTDAEQPFIARLIGDNGEEVWRSSENYVDVRGAERAVCINAEAFYVGTAKLVPSDGGNSASDSTQRIQISRSGRVDGTLSVPVVSLDERRKCRVCGCSEYSPCSPPCHWIAADLCSNPVCAAAAVDVSIDLSKQVDRG